MLSVDQYTPSTVIDIESLHGRARQQARRLAKRKQRVALGEMLPRMRQATRYRASHASAFVLPVARVTVSKRDDDNRQPYQTLGAQTTVRPYYSQPKRAIPEHERPSQVSPRPASAVPASAIAAPPRVVELVYGPSLPPLSKLS